MAGQILETYANSVTMDIDLNGLQNSQLTGYQSSLIDNTSTRYSRINVYFKVSLGENAVSRPNNGIKFYVIRGDNGSPQNIDYGASASAGLFTFSPQFVRYDLNTGANATIPIKADFTFIPLGDNLAEESISKSFTISHPGPYWGLVVVNSTGDSFLSPSYVRFTGEYQTQV